MRQYAITVHEAIWVSSTFYCQAESKEEIEKDPALYLQEGELVRTDYGETVGFLESRIEIEERIGQ